MYLLWCFLLKKRLDIQVRFSKDFEGQTEGQEEILQQMLESFSSWGKQVGLSGLVSRLQQSQEYSAQVFL